MKYNARLVLFCENDSHYHSQYKEVPISNENDNENHSHLVDREIRSPIRYGGVPSLVNELPRMLSRLDPKLGGYPEVPLIGLQ